MNHQITLEELGIIQMQIDRKDDSKVDKSEYASPCGGCICEHCSNNVDCIDKCVGEANFGCFNCDDCYYYSGKGTDNWKYACNNYKVTNQYAERVRKKFKMVRN